MLTLAQFRSQRAPVRALIYLFWIYAFVGSSVNVFMQIYIYQLFASVQLNVAIAMLSFTGIMIGFCIYGYVAAEFRLSSRYGFMASFIATALGIAMLGIASSPQGAALAMLVEGIGAGLFWLTIHTYELVETVDHERDVYSTYLSAGDQIVSLVGPAFATVLIAASRILGLDEFTLLFVITPPIFLSGFFFFRALSDYRPTPIRRHDLAHFVSDRRNQVAQLYLLGGASTHILQQIMLPLVTFAIVGSAVAVGSFNTAFAVVSAIALLLVGAYRHAGNRLTILGITSLSIAALYVYLGTTLTLVALVVYTLGCTVAQPLMRVSQHVIDLNTMDRAGHAASDFYPTMIFRDFSLWVWRMMAGGLLLIALSPHNTSAAELSIGLYACAVAFVVMFIGANRLLAVQPAPTQ